MKSLTEITVRNFHVDHFDHYPISHSLLAVVVWALLFAGVYQISRKYRVGAVVCGLALISHWVLDLIVHRPDLPLVPGSSTLLGFGLWDSLPATLALELSVFGLGLFFYLRTTRPVDRTGTISLWALVAFLLLVFASNSFCSSQTGSPRARIIATTSMASIACGRWFQRTISISAPKMWCPGTWEMWLDTETAPGLRTMSP